MRLQYVIKFVEKVDVLVVVEVRGQEGCQFVLVDFMRKRILSGTFQGVSGHWWCYYLHQEKNSIVVRSSGHDNLGCGTSGMHEVHFR